jgi:hypothetical protein
MRTEAQVETGDQGGMVQLAWHRADLTVHQVVKAFILHQNQSSSVVLSTANK